MVPLKSVSELFKAVIDSKSKWLVGSSNIKKLASDEFKGRKPGTEGEEMTTKYIAKQLKKPPGDGK